MKDNDKILVRLNAILEKLCENSLPRIKDLAKEFNVTERTIQRDIYQRLHYFPIEKNNLSQLQFTKGFVFDKSILDSGEIMFIYLALSQIKENHPDFNSKIDTIVHKLLNPHMEHNQKTKEEVNQKVIKSIESAMLRNNIITLHIKKKHLEVKPFKIINSDANHMLLAEDCKDGIVKTIPLKMVSDISKQTTKFKIKRSQEEALNNVHTAWFDAPDFDLEF